MSAAPRRARGRARGSPSCARRDSPLAPVVIEGRKIATTFWGKSWCDNLERYSDFANRLPRGRSYVRNGSVVDLQIAPGVVTALVSGSDALHGARDGRRAARAALAPRVRATCPGAIDSVIELLQGRLSDGVMTRLCAEGTGLFPSPREIAFACSCPDAASMCKHVAAVLYGIGARLDHEPALLFTLRQVREADLVGGAGARAAASLVSGRGEAASASRRIADEASLSEVFGIEVVGGGPAAHPGAAEVSERAPAARSAGARGRRKKTSAAKQSAPTRKAAKAGATKRTPVRGGRKK